MADAICVMSLTKTPEQVWEEVKRETDKKYGRFYQSCTKTEITRRVRKTRQKLNFRDVSRTIENSENTHACETPGSRSCGIITVALILKFLVVSKDL